MNWYKQSALSRAKYEKVCYQLVRFVRPGESAPIRCVTVFWNPTPSEYRSLLKDFEMPRGYIFTSGDFAVWEGSLDTHWGAEQALQSKGYEMKESIPVYPYLDGLHITDSSERTNYHHNPDIKNVIKNHPIVKKIFPNNLDIAYYDESIVGDWTSLNKTAEIFIGEDYGYDDMIDILETEVETPQQAVEILSKFKVPSKIITFPQAEPIVRFENKVWDSGFIKDAVEWVSDIPDLYLDYYYEKPEQNFWDTVGKGSVVYHATSEDNIESIESNGLYADCQTRGISNSSMACAVFASYESDEIGAYGNVIYAIDLGAMKSDGFMPEVSGEEPLEEAEHRNIIAHLIGLEDVDFSSDYSSDGLSPNTVAIYANIPAKYIKRV